MKLHEKVKNYEAQVVQWNDAFNNQQLEINKLKSALKDLSVGLVPTNYDDKWTHTTKMQYKAATTLSEYKHVKAPRFELY